MPTTISTDFNNADLLRKLSDNGVSFMLVGGGAVAAYGCRDDLHLPEKPPKAGLRLNWRKPMDDLNKKGVGDIAQRAEGEREMTSLLAVILTSSAVR